MRATPLPDRTNLQRKTFLALFFLSAYLFWRVLEPIWIPVFLGLVIAVGVYPLQEKLYRRFPRHPGISASILTAAVLTIAAGICGFLILIVGHRLLVIAREASERYAQHGTSGLLGPDLMHFLQRVGADPATVHKRIAEVSRDVAGTLGHGATTLLSATAALIFTFIFTALTSYYLLVEGQQGTSWLVEVLPLPDGQVWTIVRNVRDVTRAMLLGTGVTALYQGVVGFLGYWVCGVDSPIVWAALTAIASLLPGIGTALIWVPVSLYLMATGRLGFGIGLFIWGTLAVVFVADYILRPKLVGAKMRMNELLVFISIFGGIEAFGVMGLILGPISVAVFLSLIRLYQADYRPEGPVRTPDVTQAQTEHAPPPPPEPAAPDALPVPAAPQP